MGNNKPILTPEVIELVKSIAQSTIMDHKHSWIEFTTELDMYDEAIKQGDSKMHDNQFKVIVDKLEKIVERLPRAEPKPEKGCSEIPSGEKKFKYDIGDKLWCKRIRYGDNGNIAPGTVTIVGGQVADSYLVRYATGGTRWVLKESLSPIKNGVHVCIKTDAKHSVYEIICCDLDVLQLRNVVTGERCCVMSVNELILAEEKDWIVDDKGIKWSAKYNINGYINVNANNVRITTKSGDTLEEHNMVMERLCNAMNIPIQE